MKILVTAFESFGENTINASAEALKNLPSQIGNNKIEKVTLPTVFKKATDVLVTFLNRYQPDVVVSIGEAGGRSEITVERVAINIDDARLPDNDNQVPIQKLIREDGDDGYFSTLPLKDIVEAVRMTKIPASISNTAGTYVCNHVMYEALYWSKRQSKNVQSGFIHVPYLPLEVVQSGRNLPSLSLDLITCAIETAIKTIIKN
ncbi:pyroglutamyl-peptidase I [Holzapfeliella floricola]|uniref:Pyroglutamyl-peptidase I n=1 Tax=Holzapfeliella floricola DSM 23037 = JCM 16512 TaxID=1423744 RepID=A0A0R2DJT3_9LACO|nr:pyroglutamyl-peptidase I [Holzapfeliella floricola]KRN04352.1 pyrrolidone-carboxylate peptidase [Holzapfeliella floricola DSM 23037 = JCM 16512]